MAPTARRARPEDLPAIDAFVAGAPRATAYHQSAVLGVLREAGCGVACFVARERRHGPIQGILPLALTQSPLFGTYATSVPFFNYGGVLADDEAAQRALVEEAWAWAAARGARHMVLRQTADRPLAFLPATHGKETLTLPLPPGDVDALFARIGSKTRNLVRKAQKAGLADAVLGAEGISAFHRVYAARLRELGSPSLPARFFRALAAALGGAVRIHIVRAGGAVAAASLTLRFRDRVEVPWAASLDRFGHTSANMLLYWQMLEHATRGGARLFDFGRSTPGTGPYRFKLQWGAAPEALPWHFLAPGGKAPTGDLAPTNPRYALAIRAWQRLPLGVTRTLGGLLAVQLP